MTTFVVLLPLSVMVTAIIIWQYPGALHAKSTRFAVSLTLLSTTAALTASILNAPDALLNALGIASAVSAAWCVYTAHRSNDSLSAATSVHTDMLQAVIDAQPAALAYFDANLRIQCWSEAYATDFAVTTGQPLVRNTHLREILAARVLAMDLKDEAANFEIERRLNAHINFETSEFEYKGQDLLVMRFPAPEQGSIVWAVDIGRIKKAERETEAAMELLRTVTDSQAVHLAYFDCEGRLQFWNRLYASAFSRQTGMAPARGMSHAEIVGHRVSTENRTPEDAAREVQRRLSTFKVGTNLELKVDGKDLLLTRTAGPDGGTISAAIDVTSIKRAEREVRQTREMLQSIIDAQPVALAYFDAEHTLQFWNKNYGEGFTAQTGEQLRVGRDQRSIAESRIAATHTRAEDVERELRNLALGVEDLTGLELKQLKRDKLVTRTKLPHGGFISTSVDITDLKTVERELERTKSLLQQLIDAQPAMLAYFDADGRLQFWSADHGEQFESETGQTLQQGMTFEEVALARVQAARNVACDSVAQEVVRRAESFRNLEPFERRLLDVDLLIHRARTPDGGTVATAVDVSDLKQTQRVLEQRTAELERSNNDLEQFAYVASHDLNEPLRTIHSYIELFCDQYQDKFDSDATHYLDITVDAAIRMRQLIQELLQYAEAGNATQQVQEIDLNQFVAEVAEGFQTDYAAVGGAFSFAELPVIHADPRMLHQLLRNLFENALKYRSDRPLEVVVSVSRTDDFWNFHIRDNGIGIAEQYTQRIFELFGRLHSRQEIPGTGIGLAICERILRRAGGRIYVRSVSGAGSTFCFELPVRPLVEPDALADRVADAGTASPRLHHQNNRKAHVG